MNGASLTLHAPAFGAPAFGQVAALSAVSLICAPASLAHASLIATVAVALAGQPPHLGAPALDWRGFASIAVGKTNRIHTITAKIARTSAARGQRGNTAGVVGVSGFSK
jgi:hypothetical protein